MNPLSPELPTASQAAFRMISLRLIPIVSIEANVFAPSFNEDAMIYGTKFNGRNAQRKPIVLNGVLWN